ncbi:MAG: DM13 domain-containing protein [Acidobacteriota bacterium]
MIHRVSILVLLALAFVAPLIAAEPVASGEWSKKSFRIDGSWQIVDEGGSLWVVLDDSFKTKKAPDLKLFLSPKSLAEVGNRNATDGSVLIAPLDSNRGAQRYAIPKGTDLAAFQTLLIHCEKYSKLWGGAALE